MNFIKIVGPLNLEVLRKGFFVFQNRYDSRKPYFLYFKYAKGCAQSAL